MPRGPHILGSQRPTKKAFVRENGTGPEGPGVGGGSIQSLAPRRRLFLHLSLSPIALALHLGSTSSLPISLVPARTALVARQISCFFKE